MKYIPSIAFEEMSGSAKGVTAAKVKSRKCIRNRGYGGNTRTEFQASVKSVFKQLSQAWKNLTNAQILAWNAAAGTAEARAVLGTKGKISGANLFMRLNYWVVYCGGQIMTSVPTLTGVPTPEDATVVLTTAAMTFQLADIPAQHENLKLVIQASEPQGNGISKAYSKAAAFDAPLTVTVEDIDIKAKYDAKYGAPSAGAPKVFFKYFFVNTVTGEKSGEKMVSAVLSNG